MVIKMRLDPPFTWTQRDRYAVLALAVVVTAVLVTYARPSGDESGSKVPAPKASNEIVAAAWAGNCGLPPATTKLSYGGARFAGVEKYPAWIRKADVGGGYTLEGVLDECNEQVLVRGGASGRPITIAPANRAAAVALGGSMGEEFRTVITETIKQARRDNAAAVRISGGAPAIEFEGIAFSTDEPSFTAFSILSDIRAFGEPRDAAELDTRIEEYTSENKSAGAIAAWDGWIILGPEVAQSLAATSFHSHDEREVARDNRMYVAAVLRHELEHATTPAAPEAFADESLAWLEEGTAETLARWPGTVCATVQRTGHLCTSSAWKEEVAYLDYTWSVSELLEMAGVDIRADQRPKAVALLQGVPLEQVPKRLVDAIARQHDLSKAERRVLANGIGRLDGTYSTLMDLQKRIGIDNTLSAPGAVEYGPWYT